MAATDGLSGRGKGRIDESTRQFVARAVGALLCAVPLEAVAEESGGDLGLEIDASLYFYSELGRVTTFGPVAFIGWEPSPERKLSVQASVDVLTGASPNAARALPIPQTFSTPSGQGVYTVAADDTPLVEMERDTRVAGQLGYTERFDRIHSLSVGIGGSNEYDYRAIRGSLGWSSELGRRNTTVGAQLRYEHAWNLPIGHVPVPLALLDADDSKGGKSAEKNVLGIAASITQTLSRTTLAQELQSVTLRGGYRFYLDDWGITTHTGNLGVRVALTDEFHGLATFRGSFQSKASFYRFSLAPDQRADHVSADYRLGDLATLSGFVGVGLTVAEDHQLRLRAGPMHQMPLADGRFPSVTAIMGQLSYVGEF